MKVVAAQTHFTVVDLKSDGSAAVDLHPSSRGKALGTATVGYGVTVVTVKVRGTVRIAGGATTPLPGTYASPVLTFRSRADHAPPGTDAFDGAQSSAVFTRYVRPRQHPQDAAPGRNDRQRVPRGSPPHRHRLADDPRVPHPAAHGLHQAAVPDATRSRSLRSGVSEFPADRGVAHPARCARPGDRRVCSRSGHRG